MKLYQFHFSHFCEKARWAFNYLQIPVQIKNVTAGLHFEAINALAPGSTVPVLETKDTIIQGSSKIIDFACNLAKKDTLSCKDNQSPGMNFESKLDNLIGRPFQTLVYDLLLRDKKALFALWSYQASDADRIKLEENFRAVCIGLKKQFSINTRGVEAAQNKLDQILEETDRLYAQNDFLSGNSFSRLDLTLAALLSPFLIPKEHDSYDCIMAANFPDEYFSFMKKYEKNPTFIRARELYCQYRA